MKKTSAICVSAARSDTRQSRPIDASIPKSTPGAGRGPGRRRGGREHSFLALAKGIDWRRRRRKVKVSTFFDSTKNLSRRKKTSLPPPCSSRPRARSHAVPALSHRNASLLLLSPNLLYTEKPRKKNKPKKQKTRPYHLVVNPLIKLRNSKTFPFLSALFPAPGAGATALSPLLQTTKKTSVTAPEMPQNATSATCPTEAARRSCEVGTKGSHARRTVAAAAPGEASRASLPKAPPHPERPQPYHATRNGPAVVRRSRAARGSPWEARPIAAKARRHAPSPAASKRDRGRPPPSAAPESTCATPPQAVEARFSTRSSCWSVERCVCV